ncbi:uncharacterized protein [Cherax quadricarinatus]|uniref:uncharacterized protein isoform X2 n=1 Tax=Cherax quadricarinatus TaxID=27406 RepID=UPI00387E4315
MATLVGSRRTRWSVVLSVLGVGWVVATSVTAFGMYMVACHNSVSAVSYGTRVDARESTSQASLRSGSWNGCTGGWTLGQGHLVLVVGSLLNMVLLVTMICLLLHEKLAHKIIKDNPPDYESLIKAETPPPSFDEHIGLGLWNTGIQSSDSAATKIHLLINISHKKNTWRRFQGSTPPRPGL